MVATRARKTRKLATVTWVSGQSVQRDLPKDCVLEKIVCTLSGTFVTTFSSSPTAAEVSSFDSLVRTIDIRVDGNRVIKSVRPHLLHMQQLLYSKFQAVRKSSAGAAAAYDNDPTADGGVAFGSTTNITTVKEAVTIMFGYPFAKAEHYPITFLNLKGRSSAEIVFQCNPLSGTSQLLDKANNVSFSSVSLQIEITLYEVEYPANQYFAEYKQTFKEYTVSAAQTDFPVDLPRGNWLLGLDIFCIMDSGGVDSTASIRKKPNNNGITDMKVMINGNQIVTYQTFKESQAETRQRFGPDAKFSSNISRLDGYTRIDFLETKGPNNGGDIESALYAKLPQVDNLQLLLTTRTADASSNVYPLSITVGTDELVRP